METQVLKLPEVAAWLRVHESTIYRLLRAHDIPAFKVGQDWRFNREAVENWLASRPTTVDGPRRHRPA